MNRYARCPAAQPWIEKRRRDRGNSLFWALIAFAFAAGGFSGLAVYAIMTMGGPR